MTYEFSLSSLFIGLLILMLGIAFVRYHQWIADNFGGGIASYERYKLYSFIVCILGLIVMINLHAFILGLVFTSIFNR